MLPHKRRFEAIGTMWQIESDRRIDHATWMSIAAHIEQFDATYSRFRSDSLVAQVAKRAGHYEFPNDSIALISLYRTLYNLTEGKVTPLIGAMLEKAGYDANYSFTARSQAALPTWEAAMEWQGSTLLTTQPLVLDVGAAGKGCLIDALSTILDKAHIASYVIDGSGDLRHKGVSENIVGLECPHDPTKIIGTVSIQNTSLCASATNRRTWGEGIHHIFDPHTMEPTQNIIATWVITPNAMLADGLATALFFTDPARLQNTFDFQYVRMHYNGSIDYSSQLKEGLYI